MSLGSHASPRAKSVVYLTPPHVLRALGPFDLDPCAAPSPRPFPTATIHYELPLDGLAAEWFGRVWLNPPFGREASRWLDRLASHGNGVALIPARTETRQFYDHVWNKADAILFVRGRIHFHAGFDTSVDAAGYRQEVKAGDPFPYAMGAPCVLIAYGRDNAESRRTKALGVVLEIPRRS